MQVTGDDHPLDLVGALEDLHDLGLPHVALHREVAGVARPAEDLHRIGRDLHGIVRGDELRHGRLLGERLPEVLQSCGGEHRRPGGRQGRLHVREQERQTLVFDDRMAEGLPLLRVVHRRIQRALGQSGRAGRDTQAAGIECGQGDLQPLPFFTDPPVDGDADVVEGQCRGR